MRSIQKLTISGETNFYDKKYLLGQVIKKNDLAIKTLFSLSFFV
jgi:hypothetical protein